MADHVKQVWMLNHYAAEPGGIGGTRHYHLAEGLHRHNWNTTILAASVELNSGRQRLEEGEKYRLDRRGDVPFLWVRVPQYKGNGVGRMLNMLSYTCRVLLPGPTRELPRPDAVVGSSVHPFAAWAGAILARRFKVPFIFEVRDLWPQTLIDLGRLKAHSPMASGMRMLERWLYRRAARIVVLLPRAVDYIAPLGVDPSKVVWIPNGVDLSLFAGTAPAPNCRSDAMSLMYFGAHGEANGLDNVLDAMRLLQDRNAQIRLRLIGDGPRKPALQAKAASLGLKNVVFEPPVPKSSIPALAAQADAYVFNLVDAPVFRYGISSNKLFDYMVSARPIVFCCDAANNPVAEAGCGLTVRPGDPPALADAIESLTRMPLEQRQTMGAHGRAHVAANYGFDSLSARFAAVLDACVEADGDHRP